MNTKLSKNATRLLMIGAIVFAVSLLASIISLVITYPTSEHINIARELVKSQSDTSALMNRGEAKYSLITLGVTTAVCFVLAIALVVYAYNRIRRERLTKNSGGMTVLIYTISSTLAAALTMLFSYFYMGATSLPGGVTGAGFSLFGNVIVTFIFSFLVVLIAERRFDRKHSFLVE